MSPLTNNSRTNYLKELLRFFLSLFLFLLFPTISFGQILNGKIIDSDSDPIPFATIYHQQSDKHVHSTIDGLFEIENVKIGDSLIFNVVGFNRYKTTVDNTTKTIIIAMSKSAFELDEIIVKSDIDALNIFTKIDLKTAPVSSSQEVLRSVPGLIIGQHAGGGKAEQIFLRGFDVDHGTDVNITVDGLPVNMVSHAHGQGYADLHFLIPEMIEKVNFGKGPYNADKGNFATAGHVEFQTKDQLDKSIVKMEYGSFNSLRTLGMFKVITQEKKSAYVASDIQLSDGPFDSKQNFRRINLAGKFTNRLDNDDKIQLLVSHFNSQWDASGQIPERLVENGTIGRFGSVDDTEGGITSRSNLKVGYVKNINKSSFVKSELYLSKYDFELYSNFTFFLEDSINGDQIRQKEDRTMIGASTEWNKFFPHDHSLKIGVGFRNDRVLDDELSRTKNRVTTLSNVQLGDVDETNFYGYISTDLVFDKLTINPAIRVDALNFKYYDQLDSSYNTQSAEKAIVSPKINLIYSQSKNVQYYLKTGSGFHSNDTRVVVAETDKKTLPPAYGADLGTINRIASNLIMNAAFWTLLSEQEFVYVGDAGVVEPSGRSLRLGIDFGLRYQLFDSFFIFGDINYAKPRSLDESENNNRIPLAPELTVTGGINVVDLKKFNVGTQFRYIGDRPANEDNSVIADGYFIVDINMNYDLKKLTFGLAINNLLNSDWKETQFLTETRLYDEAESVEEIHFTPGAPFAVKGNITFKF